MAQTFRINSFIISVVLITMIACSSTKSISTSSMDGSSKEKAIIVKSISEEYAWIKTNYPGSRVTSQALLGSGKNHYDLLKFVTSSGETKEAYFDINSFFGKF